MRRALALLVAIALPSAARAVESGATVEVTAGAGWRVALGADPKNPGFDVVSGGVDVMAGVDVGGTWGILLGGRFRGGVVANNDAYYEMTGDLAGQLHIGERVRARLGVNAGRAWVGGFQDAATLVGGFSALSFDLNPIANGRFALALTIRLDIGGFLGTNDEFPEASVAVAAGVGGRY